MASIEGLLDIQANQLVLTRTGLSALRAGRAGESKLKRRKSERLVSETRAGRNVWG